MPTLSFSCPKCGKEHSRIKPEMSGHKVRCQCGFVFRLGSKTEKQPGVAEDLKRRRALKERKTALKANVFFDLDKPFNGNDSVEPAEVSPDDLFAPPAKRVGFSDVKSDHAVLSDASVLEPEPEVFQAEDPQLELSVPVEAISEIDDALPVAEPIKKERFRQPFDDVILDVIPSEDELLTAEFISTPTNASTPVASIPNAQSSSPFKIDHVFEPVIPAGQSIALPQSSGLPVAPPRTKSKTKRRRGQSIQSTAGPIVSLVLALVAIPYGILVVILNTMGLMSLIDLNMAMSKLGQSTSFIFPMIMTGASGLVAIGFTCAVVAAGIAAIIELSKGNRITLPNRILGIISAIMVLGIFVSFVYKAYNVSNSIGTLNNFGRSVSAERQVGVMIGMVLASIAMAIIPIAAAIVGFMRSSSK